MLTCGVGLVEGAGPVHPVVVLPVAVVRGVGGGGGGGSMPEQKEQGEGAGIGFGVNTRPVGVFTVKDGAVTWQPAIGVTRIVLGSQLVALAALFFATAASSVTVDRLAIGAGVLALVAGALWLARTRLSGKAAIRRARCRTESTYQSAWL